MQRLYRLIIISLLLTIFISGCSFTQRKITPTTSENLKGDGLVVLCYHRVLPYWILSWGRLFYPSESELSRYAISTREFTRQLKYLTEQGVRFVTPQEAEDYLRGHKSISGKLVLITFDDGDLSIYKHAFPLLKEKHIPFLLFFIADQAGKEWEGFNMCSWDQVKEMVNSGICTIGLHTYNLHYFDPRTKKPVFLLQDKEKLFVSDTEKGIACIEKQLGIRVKYFAYPYGFGTPSTDRILMKHGIFNIFTLKSRVNHPGDPCFFIGRILVTPNSWSQVAAWAHRH
ncbi:polysaccharide deacetylase family protein [Thermoanaerobacterium sp. RBIITD]|uniref:polysaccharide deacetylase family protein n=1 Tax=Thermoanaerobacterium sp. RBIITD TaxID=1550240 RepID=UPI000BC057E0|nr:polysaccharide deacetylase family protein [Thermoanaerobacterium sp. RBIITD]SNX54973.1 Polysaccharide deacetylase [Thermoanaerobacterium sp. RBIITD]